MIQWSGEAGSVYDVHRAIDLTTAFGVAASNVTVPSYTDFTDAASAFYRIEAR